MVDTITCNEGRSHRLLFGRHGFRLAYTIWPTDDLSTSAQNVLNAQADLLPRFGL